MSDFSELIGHKNQIEAIKKMHGSGRLPHALALVGPGHVGKTSFAKYLAEYIGCDLVRDLTIYDDSDQGLVVEQARELKSRLSLTTGKNQYKVGIITRAENMTDQAANALLKVLEEPPKHSLIILTITNFYQLLPTIQSRIQKLNFGFVSKGEMVSIFDESDLDSREQGLIQDLSQGRPGIAMQLIEDEELRRFYKEAREHYQVLLSGERNKKMLSAERIAADYDRKQVRQFLNLAGQWWTAKPTNSNLGKEILSSLEDFEYNVNTKLLLDNLFLYEKN